MCWPTSGDGGQVINASEYVTLAWGLVGVLCVYYLARNVARSWHRRQYERRKREPGDPARYLAERRVEQEGVLLAVGVVLAAAGVATNFVSVPSLDTIDGWLRFGIRGSLAVAQVGLAFHSALIHVNHHTALGVLSAWQLRQQMGRRQESTRRAKTATTEAVTPAREREDA